MLGTDTKTDVVCNRPSGTGDVAAKHKQEHTMTVKTRWVAVMGIALLAFALFVGTALAQSDEPAQSEAPTPGKCCLV